MNKHLSEFERRRDRVNLNIINQDAEEFEDLFYQFNQGKHPKASRAKVILIAMRSMIYQKDDKVGRAFDLLRRDLEPYLDDDLNFILEMARIATVRPDLRAQIKRALENRSKYK